MRTIRAGIAGIFLVLTCLYIPADAQERVLMSLNTDWKFTKGDPPNAHLPSFRDAQWETVRIPHDWAVAGPFDPKGSADTGKLPWKGQGWYRKKFVLPAGYAGKQLYLLFDGVMAFPRVYVNGQLAGGWDYGYNSFYLDISKWALPGKENTIAVSVDTREHDSRWYPGAGIYRKVQLLVADPVHVGIWGTFVTTPDVREQWADVRAQTEVLNNGADEVQIALEQYLISPDGEIVAADTVSFALPAGGMHRAEQWFTLTRPQRWDIGSPKMYRLRSVLRKNGQVCDREETAFGVRSFRFTASDGFFLNDRKVHLKGVNLHHDHGALGGKFYRRAMERQLEIMKSMGVNAIRNSHNVAAPELLELCDRMGLLVFNEAFDKWDQKADILPGADFDEFAERNVGNFVRRDRNHPSVILWSVGNEMADVQGNYNSGMQKLHTMLNILQRHDPTRPTTIASDQMQSVRWRHFDLYDVHSWNYGRRYLPARHAEPGKAVIISESASTVSTRGFYEFPLPKTKTDFTQSFQVSSYDLNAPDWAEIPDDDFLWQEEDRYVAGEFVWTGFDYLGEPTPYNDHAVRQGIITPEQSARSSYFGIVDLAGIPKDRYYLYKSYWKPEETTVHLLPHWNWEGREGQPTPVFVYTNGDCAELFLNGRSLGKRCKDPKSPNSAERYRLMWMDVPYAPGEIKAVVYREGKVIGEAVRKTAGAPSALKLTPDRTRLLANGEDLCYILVEAFDAAGNPCPLADDLVRFSVEGAAVLEAVDNGNPQSLESFMAPQRKLFYGKAMLILRTTEQSGKIRVTAQSAGMQSAQAEMESWK